VFSFFTAPYFLSESALWKFFGEDSLHRSLITSKINACCCFSVAVSRAGMQKYNTLLKRWLVAVSLFGCRELVERKRGLVAH